MATKQPPLLQERQNDIRSDIQNSSLKQPAAETARVNPEQVAKAARYQNEHVERQMAQRTSIPSEQADSELKASHLISENNEQTRQSALNTAVPLLDNQKQTHGSSLNFPGDSNVFNHPLYTSKILEQSHPRSINSLNDNAHDDTVDADNKQGEASLPAAKRFNNVVSNNATLDNAVLTNPQGLAGFDSRSSGSFPAIKTHENCEVEYLAAKDYVDKNSEIDNRKSDQKKLQPANHVTVAHCVKIQSKTKHKP